MLIYLDICCFNRPFDQQTQTLVRLQTEAKLAVQRGVREGQLELVWSAVLDLENAGNPDAERTEKLIRKMQGDDRIVVADPIDFIRHWREDDDENRV